VNKQSKEVESLFVTKAAIEELAAWMVALYPWRNLYSLSS
jgi:hypothetical protein